MNTEDTFKKINKIIVWRCKDNLFNHFKTVFLLKQYYFIGDFIDTKYKIWKYADFWTGVFYPVLIIELIKKDNSKKINISPRLNILGKIFCYSLLGVLILGLIKSGILSLSFYKSDLIFTIGGVLFISLFIIAWFITYKFICKKTIIEFKEILQTQVN